MIELKNEADSLVYSMEKSLTEYGDKLEAEEKSEVEAQISAAKELSAKDDCSLDKVKEKKVEALHQRPQWRSGRRFTRVQPY